MAGLAGLLSDAVGFLTKAAPKAAKAGEVMSIPADVAAQFAKVSDPAAISPAFGENWTDVYHWSRSPENFDTFDAEKSTGSTSRLGPHVGTKKAAEDRFKSWDEPKGFTMPLKADLSRPFNNPQTGSPWNELDLELLISAMADDHGINRRDVPPLMRQKLAQEGFTSIPYMNDVEDAGSVSNIMLTDRGEASDAVLRSRFAKFDPRSSKLSNLSAAAAGTGLLGTALQDRNTERGF